METFKHIGYNETIDADAAKIIKTLKNAVSDLERTYSSSQKNTKFKL